MNQIDNREKIKCGRGSETCILETKCGKHSETCILYIITC